MLTGKHILGKKLSQWLLAIALVAGFFTGFAGDPTSPSKYKAQTEWIRSKKPVDVFVRTFNVKFSHKLHWTQSEVFVKLFQNKLTHRAYRTNLKLLQTFSISPHFFQAKHLPQSTNEDFIIA